MDEVATRAGVEAAKRKVRRAGGLLREVAGELASLVEGQDSLGVLRAHDRQSLADAQELIELGVARHGAVDVVVIARPTGRADAARKRTSHSGRIRNTPTTAASAAEESDHGESQNSSRQTTQHERRLVQR